MDQKQHQKNGTKSPQEQSAACLAMWLATFTQVFQQPMEELAAMAYRESLKNYSASQIDRGCRECLRTCKFFPKPAEIIEGMSAPRENIGDFAPLVKRLPEAPIDEKLRQEIMAHCRGKLVEMPKVVRVVHVTDEKRAQIAAQKEKLGA